MVQTRQRVDQIEQLGFIVEDAPLPDTPANVKLWDNVTEDWTTPQNPVNAERLLRKFIYRCTACPFSGITPAEIDKHILNVRALAANHGRAVVKDYATDFGRMDQCSVCGVKSFKMWSVPQHIQGAVDDGPKHQGAGNELVRQFSRMAPVSTEQSDSRNGARTPERLATMVVPVSGQGQRAVPRLAKRRRKHNRGGRNAARNGS